MTTTIKVSDDLRDRLKAQAHQAGRTLGAHLAALADLAEREDRFAALAVAIARTPPEALESHRAETAEWERAEWADAAGG